MTSITSAYIFEKGIKLPEKCLYMLDIKEELNLLTIGYTNEIFSDELACINYFRLFKSTFMELNHYLATCKLISYDNAKETVSLFDKEMVNMNTQKGSFDGLKLNAMDTMFLDHYFRLINSEDKHFNNFFMCSDQDLSTYNGKIYIVKHNNFLTARDALRTLMSIMDIPTIVSLMKNLYMILINQYYSTEDRYRIYDTRKESAPVVHNV